MNKPPVLGPCCCECFLTRSSIDEFGLALPFPLIGSGINGVAFLVENYCKIKLS